MFRPSRVDRLLGITTTAADQAEMLRRVGIATEPAPAGSRVLVATAPQPLEVEAGDAEALIATVPTWRRDIVIEADVTEEVARVRGYETVPEILPHTPMPSYRHSPLRLRDAVRETLAGVGLSEAVTYALVAPAMVERFPPIEDEVVPGEGAAGGRPVIVTNPLSSQHSVMRQSLVGSLLEVLATNLRQGRSDVAIFEIGKGYGATDEGGTHEWWRLGIVLTGAAEPPAWNRPERPFDLDDAKGVVDLVARGLGLPSPAYTPLTDDPRLHPGRAARVRAGDGLAGRIGEAHPTLVDALDLRTAARILVAELAIAGLSGGQPDGAADDDAHASPGRRARPRGHRARVGPGRRRGSLDPASRGAAAPLDRPVRPVSRAAARRRREEPRLPARVPGRRPDPRRVGGRHGRGGGHRRAARRCRGSPSGMTRKYHPERAAERLCLAKSRC